MVSTSRRALAAVARTAAERHQRRERSARSLVDDREHRLEAAGARAIGRDADRLGRAHLPERRGGAAIWRLWAVDRTRGTVRWKRPLGGGNRRMMKQNMSSPSPVTDGRHVWVMTGTGMLQGVRLRRQGAVVARHPEGLRPLRAAVGLRLVAAAARGLRSTCRCSTGCTPTIRPTSCGSTRRPARRCGASSGRRTRGSNRPTPTRRRRCCATAGATEIVITGGDVVTGHDPATGKELWRADGLNPAQRWQLPHRRVAGRARRHDLSRRRASGRCWR